MTEADEGEAVIDTINLKLMILSCGKQEPGLGRHSFSQWQWHDLTTR